MKALTAFLLSVLVSANGYLIKVPTSPVIQPKIAPVGWVHMQKLILPLFENICEESRDPLIIKLSQDFKLETTNTDFASSEVIKNLLDLRSGKGLLLKNEIFTEYKIDDLNELKVIYDVFYYANDFDAFYKAACWARQNINCGLFVDALYSAILTRKDTENIILPAPYEILPNYFIRKDFIIKASSLIAGDEITLSDGLRNEGNSYILDVNYTKQIYNNEDETKLVHFYEDIGLNSYYYLTKLKISPWIISNLKDNRYGEYLYFLIKQLMARYNLERYSNGLPELECIDWDYLNKIPYYDSMLVYSDGHDFSYRTLDHIVDNEKLTLLKNIENNIATVVAHMRDGGFNKSEILNHLMKILLTTEKSYENIALQILNDDTTMNNRPPSVLGHYMTTLRDPIFWTINKEMVELIDKALKVLPGYSRDELYFPGVEIINVEVKKMSTYFENFVFDITDALKTGEKDTTFKVKISQPRLTHKPFAIKINITSLVSQKGLLKIYLGPKIMPGEHALKKNLFMLLDCFEVNLKFGSNIITRTSADISDSSDDLLSLYTIRKRITDAEFGLDSTVKLKPIEEQIKFPSRLVIPKGLPEGLPIQLFVFVVPLGRALGGRLLNKEINKDALFSPGFPLDLDIEVQQLFDLPNALVKDILVMHKESDGQAVNYGGRPGVKSWPNNGYEISSEPVVLPLAARPDFTLRKEPFDYKSKRGQYGKSEDNAAKRFDYKYKKDSNKVDDRPFTINKDKYVTKSDITTTKINTYIPNDMIEISKNNFQYTITTDRYLDEANTFLLDKKIQDKGINEEVRIDVTSNEKINANKKPEYLDEILHKVVIKNGSVGMHDTIEPDATREESNEVMWNKVNKHKVIDIMDNDKKLRDTKSEYSDEETNYNKVDKNEIIDISKTSRTNKRFPTIYDVLFYSFEDINGSAEKVYE